MTTSPSFFLPQIELGMYAEFLAEATKAYEA